jgi:hypothetical protein
MADFSNKQIQDVWEKGTTVENYDSTKYRKDLAGAWIARNDYGKETQLGWQIDHVYPSSKGGDENLINLRPMHWENNQSKADDYPKYKTVKSSKDDKNIDDPNSFTVNENLQGELKKLYKIK